MSVLAPSTADRMMAPPTAAFLPNSATWVRVRVSGRGRVRGRGRG